MPHYVRPQAANFHEYANEWARTTEPRNLEAAASAGAATVAKTAKSALHSASSWFDSEVNKAYSKATAPEWNRWPDNPYEPYCWKKYRKGGFEYDLVAYRRRRRGCLERILCCGA
eukprot:Gregarina_sp_Poly_1__9179@NODE_564_length_7515_cov_115_964823_g443_i0_p8_GENE_NODE_564_length_7515_cov_115_964823_g443_i0NODE_564_length_7515_cov_115_964823_g443_i0_p8_ORF_typecomplete_len115_score13_35_NODE_564_length_7515_cov_115_964823_g443_i063826726